MAFFFRISTTGAVRASVITELCVSRLPTTTGVTVTLAGPVAGVTCVLCPAAQQLSCGVREILLPFDVDPLLLIV